MEDEKKGRKTGDDNYDDNKNDNDLKLEAALALSELES